MGDVGEEDEDIIGVDSGANGEATGAAEDVSCGEMAPFKRCTRDVSAVSRTSFGGLEDSGFCWRYCVVGAEFWREDLVL